MYVREEGSVEAFVALLFDGAFSLAVTLSSPVLWRLGGGVLQMLCAVFWGGCLRILNGVQAPPAPGRNFERKPLAQTFSMAEADAGTPTAAAGEAGTPTAAAGDAGTPTAATGDGTSTAAKLLSHVTARRAQSKAILRRVAARKEHSKDLIQAITSHKRAQEASEQEGEDERQRADERARARAAETAKAVKARLHAAKLRPSSPRRPTPTRRELGESAARANCYIAALATSLDPQH